MKKLIAVLIAAYSATGILSACKKSKTSKLEVYSSKKEAELACSSWQKKGGTWELKVNDFRISATDQEKVPAFPIKIESNNDKIKEDLTSQKEEKELTLYLPLVNSGKDRRKQNEDFEIRTIGEKWLKYDRRLCKMNKIGAKMILGKEYSINSGEKVTKSNIPSLRTEKTFEFSK